MGRPLAFDTLVDKAVRASGVSRRQFAEEAMLSTLTLLKPRAQDQSRGKIHWTSLVMIGARMGVFKPGEVIGPDDPRLDKLASINLRSTHGRGAARWNEYR